MMGSSWELSEQDIIDAPIDRLAMTVLREWVNTDQWNLWNFLNSTNEFASAARNALSEAQAWLLNHGCLARSPTQTSSDAAFVTRLGHRLLEEGPESMRAAERLSVDLHPRLRKVQSQFLLGEYELAAFAAMREVEIYVRELAEADDSLIGVKLMTYALREDGPLRNENLDNGEQVGMMNLFQGAIAVFKNPPSHRQVDYSDATEASGVVLLADLLLRILERSKPA